MKRYSGEDKINGVIWYNYPVLANYRTITVFEKSKHHFFRVKLGKQDGKVVSGYDYELESGLGGGCSPGRKWGEYKTKDEALITEIERMLNEFRNRKDDYAARDAVKRILKFKEKFTQGELFDLAGFTPGGCRWLD